LHNNSLFGTVTPKTVTPKTVTPKTVTPKTVTPKTVTPKTVTPQTVTPKTVTPKTVTLFRKKIPSTKISIETGAFSARVGSETGGRSAANFFVEIILIYYLKSPRVKLHITPRSSRFTLGPNFTLKANLRPKLTLQQGQISIPCSNFNP
jgi:hypothetical protein